MNPDKDLAVAIQVKRAMAKKKKMAMGGDVPDEHDQDMDLMADESMEPMTDEMPAEEDYGREYAHGDLVRAIRAKKYANGGAVEANEALAKKSNMDDWLASGDADLEQEESSPFEKRKLRLRRILIPSMD